jgi:hypothetical protein
MLNIGGYVDSTFKDMAKYEYFINDENCSKISKLAKKKATVPISLPLDTFENWYKLSQIKVTFLPLKNNNVIKPFTPSSPSSKSPKWWKIYNGLKHDLSTNLSDANLMNVRDALGSAFVLNAIHIPSYITLLSNRIIIREDGGFYFKPGGTISKETIARIEKWFFEENKMLGILITDLYGIYYHQNFPGS